MLKVSIIITMHNSAKTITKCLDSILNQTFPDIEAIIIDMNSTDDSLSICEKYTLKDKRIKVVIQNHPDKNSARNLGLSLTKGDYLMFLNSQDYLVPDAVEKSLSIAQKTNSDIIIFEWYEHTYKGLLPAPVPCKIRNNTLALVGDILGDRQPAYIWNKLYATSLWKEASFVSLENETDVIKKLFAKANKAFYLPVPLCVHNCSYKARYNIPLRKNLSPKQNLLTTISLKLSTLLK